MEHFSFPHVQATVLAPDDDAFIGSMHGPNLGKRAFGQHASAIGRPYTEGASSPVCTSQPKQGRAFVFHGFGLGRNRGPGRRPTLFSGFGSTDGQTGVRCGHVTFHHAGQVLDGALFSGQNCSLMGDDVAVGLAKESLRSTSSTASDWKRSRGQRVGKWGRGGHVKMAASRPTKTRKKTVVNLDEGPWTLIHSLHPLENTI